MPIGPAHALTLWDAVAEWQPDGTVDQQSALALEIAPEYDLICSYVADRLDVLARHAPRAGQRQCPSWPGDNRRC